MSDEGVGKLRIGMSVESARRECTVVRDTTGPRAEGMPSRKIAVLFPLARLLALRKPQRMTGEGALFVMSPDHCGLSFRLSETGSPILRDPSPTALSRLSATTRVSDILIVGYHK